VAEKSEKSESKTEDKPATTAGDTERIKYTRERLLESSQALTGHPKHVLAGALVDLGGDEDEELTVKQAQAAIEKHLSREVYSEEDED
jgi:hypothetical protein